MSEPYYLPAKSLPTYRNECLIDQEFICPICNTVIDPSKAVADHDHSTGHHRHILHRGCNSLIGKVENNFKRFGVTSEQLRNICPIIWEYINADYSMNPLHHTSKPKVKKPSKKRSKPVVAPSNALEFLDHANS